jgi:hypothetical protein
MTPTPKETGVRVFQCFIDNAAVFHTTDQLSYRETVEELRV